ncbi:C-type lectin domain family 4 member E-like, partial [Boleophthalmus pectinirostris]|uniref:C-type lectin domain family 4 member E-like n=1 Tax=Boleophthalmus pectinirostris TaxID=150288 RepID=UPI00242AF7BB
RSLRLHCDVGWELNGTSCYYFSTLKLSWSQSRRQCQKASGDLVKIESREEQRFLFGKVRHLMSEDEEKFWIGLTDSETEGEWKWIDGSALDPSLSFWYRYGDNIQPDNWGSLFYPEEDCGRIGKKTGSGFEEKCWFDQHCGTSNRFICEKTASPESPQK